MNDVFITQRFLQIFLFVSPDLFIGHLEIKKISITFAAEIRRFTFDRYWA